MSTPSENSMVFDRKTRSDQDLLKIYEKLILPRLIEEKMLILLRQGKISKWFSGIGQEAISVGAALALNSEEYILPMHRNLGVFTSRDVALEQLFAQFQGKVDGFTKGRDRSFHFGSQAHNIVGMISHLGPQLGIADGIGVGNLLDKNGRAVLVFTGDGGTSEGDFHEAVNVASVWNLPVIFVIENNGYGLSTPSSQQFNFDSFVIKGPAYGMEAVSVDGNNILEVLNELVPIVEDVRKNPRPFIFEAKTFRMRGHEEASGTKYVPKKLMEHWAKKDPIVNYEDYLMKQGINESVLDNLKSGLKKEINAAVKKAFAKPSIVADSNTEVEDLFDTTEIENVPPSELKKPLRFVDAIKEGLDQSLERNENLVIMGQDVADYGGVFKITEGFLEKYGAERIRNTPLCESAILGAALGLSIVGKKAVVEMQFADFVTCGFNQIVNNLAKSHYRWSQNADVVVRMPTGAGVGAGPFHSQSNESWFFHTPGLKIAYPSNPADAKGLLATSIEDRNPVLFFEHKFLYRSITGDVPEDYYNLPFSQAKISNEGNDCTIVTYGLGVHWGMELVEDFPGIEVIDLRTLVPWDKETVLESVRKTGKCLVLHEDCLTGGIGAEIASWIGENCFEYLDAPVKRVGSLDTPVPFAKDLERNFLGNSRLKETLTELLNY